MCVPPFVFCLSRIAKIFVFSWKKSPYCFVVVLEVCTFASAFAQNLAARMSGEEIFDRMWQQRKNKAAPVLACACFFRALAECRQATSIAGRTDRLGVALFCAMPWDILQWRVWSWLRMNASYRLNTCKSRGSITKACFCWWRPAHGWVTRIQPSL